MTLSPIEQLRLDASGDSLPVSALLRNALAVASELKAPSIPHWISKELSGYADTDVLPPYRIITTTIMCRTRGSIWCLALFDRNQPEEIHLNLPDEVHPNQSANFHLNLPDKPYIRQTRHSLRDPISQIESALSSGKRQVHTLSDFTRISKEAFFLNIGQVPPEFDQELFEELLRASLPSASGKSGLVFNRSLPGCQKKMTLEYGYEITDACLSTVISQVRAQVLEWSKTLGMEAPPSVSFPIWMYKLGHSAFWRMYTLGRSAFWWIYKLGYSGLRWAWSDPVWSKVIATGICTAMFGGLGYSAYLLGWLGRLLRSVGG